MRMPRYYACHAHRLKREMVVAIILLYIIIVGCWCLARNIAGAQSSAALAGRGTGRILQQGLFFLRYIVLTANKIGGFPPLLPGSLISSKDPPIYAYCAPRWCVPPCVTEPFKNHSELGLARKYSRPTPPLIKNNIRHLST